jgi:hypothetical protein
MVPPLIGFIVAAWLAAGPPSAADQQSVTIDQLRTLLLDLAHEPDSQIAQRVGSLRLSERLSDAGLQQIDNTQHPGRQTREALRLMADSSAFLDPPTEEIPARAAPSIAEQQAMMNGAVQFVAVTLKRLPDFFATRTTQSFDDLPLLTTSSSWAPNGEMHADGTFSQEITFRNGREVAGARRAKASSLGKVAILSGLTSTGEFGSLQAVILRDIVHGNLEWGHWETTPSGVVAVFQYAVPATQSHYEVDYCCVRSYQDPTSYRGFAFGGIPNAYHGKPGYHGTMSIDPATGAIVRITIEALLRQSDPITDGGVAIDYGPVAIEGDKTYVCPIRSVAISVTRSQVAGAFTPRIVRRINEVTFDNYHLFHATVQMVTPASQ